ncbi:unnamed protein product [Symbiodinium sp. CCMP2456]|nr:unnamed protein product [Symbiodinium sp. CCMP2456]
MQRELIEKLQKKVDPEEAEVSLAQKQRSSEESVQEAHDVLKRVIQKHAHQREHREYHPEAQKRSSKPSGEEAGEEGLVQSPREQRALLQKRDERLGPLKEWGEEAYDEGKKQVDNAKRTLDKQIDSAVKRLDGTGLTGNALTQAYRRAREAGNAARFVANTAISTVEMAVSILTGGFDNWDASCTNTEPTIGVTGSELYITFGRQHCTVSLMNQVMTLYDFNWGRKAVNLPVLSMLPQQLRDLATAPLNVINAQMTFATGIANCVNADQPLGLIECLGHKIIDRVPPLSYLNRISDILTEVIEVFARIAGTVVEKAMEKGPSLVQMAATAKFPAAGEPPVLHHKGTNLIIESHTQQMKRLGGSGPPREMAAMQTNARQSQAGDDPDGAITYDMGSSDDVHATKLITQFNGRETDTSSCLAFAPKNRAGDGVSKADWQVGDQKDFLKLEPWAVPCDNVWMKDNWNRWQGYTFYTQPSAIEKCVTVTFNLGMQPVVAFVGGLQFEILPAPLFELGTTVCWPNQQPGGVDLSVLRSEVKSAGILLFSRTLRLTKRFGGGTDFVSSNYKGGYSTWRSNAGIAQGETTVPKDELGRTSLLETNQSHDAEEEEAEEALQTQWRTDSEDLYLASVDYGVNLNTSVNKTFEAFGEEAAMHMGTERVGRDVFKLFSFKNPGLVNFKIEGLMNGNILEMGMEMGFGPYSSPSKRIPLVNIAHQFSLILAGMPFVSSRSKLKAIASLNDFSIKDMGKTRGLPLKPGSIIALYSPHCRRFMHMNSDKLGVTSEMNGHGVPDHWTWERFTVVDAGNGEIALHSAVHNRFVGTGGVSPHRNVGDLPHDWSSERFTVVEVGNGEMAFYNRHHNRFLQMAANHVGHSGHPPNPPKLPSGWGWERFRVVAAERILVPGTTIALHSQIWNRFAKMSGGNMERSPEKSAVEMPDWWTYERFTVVDAGHGQIALHNAVHNRFIGVGAASPHRLVDQFPADHTMDFSGHMDPHHLPDGWAWERFQVVRLKPYLQPGAVVALRCPHHGRYIKMLPGAPSTLLLAKDNQSQNETFFPSSGWGNIGNIGHNIVQQVNQAAEQAARAAREAAERAAREAAEQAAREAALRGTIGVSPHMDEKNFPDDWTWERFTVIDAGNGQVAFHNSIHNRYLKMNGDRMQVSPPKAPDAFPSDWPWERFSVLPAGHGQFMFHNSAHNRAIRMTGDKVDASGHMNPHDIPADWTWERFQIVPVKPYLQPGTVVALHCAIHNRYVSMNGAALQRSPEMGVNDLPAWWDWERFTVVDAGNGQVAFHNTFHNRFLEMRGATMGTSPPHAVSDLQSSWTWQRFTVVPAGNGQFVFHNTLHNRMMRMSSSTMDSSPEKAPQDLPSPSEWTWERFRIVQVSDASETAKNVRATFD